MHRAIASNLPRRRDLLGFVGGILLTARLPAQNVGEVRVLLAGETPQHTGLVEAVRQRWSRVSTVNDVASARAGRPPPLAYLAVGPRALQSALAQPLDAPLLSVLVSRQAYGQLVGRGQARQGVSAIYAEPSPAQQMRTIAAVFHRRVSVGVLVSASSRDLEPLLREAAASSGLSLIVQPHEPSISLSRNLLRISAADAVLTFPDSELYTPESLRELLESTYRRRQPVFGFSQALVNAGTLASAYASESDLAAHLAERLAALSEGRVTAPQYPRYWRVAINVNVARSLDIVIDDAARSLGDRP